jgi:hypothetical protein
MDNVFGLLAIILFVAFLVEALVEYLFGQLIDKFPALLPYRWLLVYISAAVGVIMAFVYQFDLVSILGAFVAITIPVNPFGITLTGLAIGRGANFIHQIVQQYFPQK